MGSRLLLKLVELSALLPLSVVRALGWLLGWILLALVASRRKVVRINLELCFPLWSDKERSRCMRQIFINFAQTWLDRGWLWHSNDEIVRKRISLKGALHELDGDDPVVIFAPHFMGLDAGWVGLTQQVNRAFTTIYTNQANLQADAWILAGRKRFPNASLFGRVDGVKTIVSSLKKGVPLYLLPDMNFGPEDSVFVPFYGVQACTVPSLSRFARLAKAKVVPVVTRMTREGYEVEILPAWKDFPTENSTADTARMNLHLQSYIDKMPDQYYWVHKRFKDRPPGEGKVY